MFPRSLIIVSLLLSVATAFSQSLKKIPIGKSGCDAYTFCEIKFEETKSQDSSTVYTGECVKEGVTYGVICVKLLTPLDNLSMGEDLLIAYLDYLKAGFSITKSAGYGRGHHLNNNENTRGILDYWEDEEKNNWKIKGWTDGKFIGVMYTYSQKELPETKINLFLDGFRLPVN